MIRSEKLEFPGSQGALLAARLDWPLTPPRATALFAHCFTCSKETLASARISHALAERGIAVLRFDFTGLGESQGEFANSNFSSNVQDLLAAVAFLRQRGQAPALLVGHSLGGAAVLLAAGQVPEALAVATVGAPLDPGHVTGLFAAALPQIDASGQATVTLAGRPFTVRKQFLLDAAQQPMQAAIQHLGKALLIFHAPQDELVPEDHARLIYEAAQQPKSLVSLPGADHLLTRREDAAYVAEVLAAWASRYLPPAPPEPYPQAEAGTVVAAGELPEVFATLISAHGHLLRADEPVSSGGQDSGPSPYDLLLASLGS